MLPTRPSSRPGCSGRGTILRGRGHSRLTIASILAITGLLVMQTVDQALAGVVLPSGAGTLTIGPQAMEGNLQIRPGDTIKAGYDFTMPGAHPPAQVTVDNASITMAVTCSNGTTPPAITFALPVQTYSDPAGSPNWFPSGDQAAAAVYQGSVTAPDLCGGGVMSDANGATFNATIFSTDTTDRVNFRFHYSDNTAGSWSATITAPLTPTAKTVLSATLTPTLGLTLAVDHGSAIPSDTLTYSGTVTNTGATLTLTGDFTASASGSSTATVMSYWDDVATSLDSTTWTALAGSSAAQSGYTPAVAPPITSGMTLTSTAAAANGVTYPSSGDPLLGTTVAAGSSALWHYMASVPLTPLQVNTLLDPTKVTAIRNSFHLEVSPINPNVTQPSIINVDFSGIFLAASPAPSGAATSVTVTVQPPTGPAVTINSGTVAGLASLAPGGSANYSTTYKVPVAAAKGTSESDAAYQARLTGIEGSSLSASASASGGSTGGPVSATAPAVSTSEHLPIIAISKSGPAAPVNAGTSAIYPLALKNNGGATASGFTINDTVPSGGTGTVSGTPASLAAGASSTGVQATYAVPATQTPGNLTDTASVSWQDANGNSYGPMSSSFTTVVQNTLLGARLTLALAAGDAGLNAINASQGLQLTLLNSAGAPIPNQAVTVNVTGSNPTTLSAVTDSNGQASLSSSGKTAGVDQLQATATSGSTTVSSNTVSVTWINPIQPIATTPVQGTFFGESATQTTFVAKPGDTAAFQQSFPTINFNPPANTVPHNVSGVGPTTIPFTDVTTDAVGNFAGTIVAQGNGVQAGAGTLSSFDAVLTANFVVSQPQDVSFNVIADDGFLLGVGGGASRTSGSMVAAPASGLTPFNSYPIVGAFNQAGGSRPATYSVTVHFPSAGAYPYELDYFECCGAQMSLTMTVVSVNAGPYNLSTGYADTIRPAGTSSFPFPWNGAPNTTFIGSGSPYDTGGLRFDNNTNQPITLNHVTVDIGTRHYDPWNLNLSVPANGTLILAGATGAGAFNTSEANGVLKSGGGGGSSGFIATQWATGFFSCCGGFGLGPVGVAFDVGGNLFVMNYMSGFLYKFGPSGGVSGPSTQVNAVAIQGCPAGLAFSKDGKHLYLAVQCQGTVVEVDQATGVVLRTLASGISGATGLATDPLSGDLFVSQPNGTPTIQRIQNPLSASPTVSVYSSPGTTDGIAFGPDGSLYGSVGGGQVVIIAGTNAASPGTVLTRIQNSTALAGNDGIALLPPPPGAVGISIVVNSNNGVLVEIDNPQTATPTFRNIFTGGSRGDFAAVGPDGCLYATQTASVIKVTASDGSCPFIPSICLPNPVIPQVHVTINGFTFNYNDSGQALNSGGIDGECNGTNESQAWQQIGGKGGPINIPLPPATTLALQAAPSNGHIVGQSQAFTVAAMDGAGHTVPNVAVQLSVSGANPQQLAGSTDVNGTATFSFIGSNPGTDTVTATALISGLRTVSNAVPIQWTIPAPGGPIPGVSGPAPPSVVVTSPADGSAVSQAVAITAAISAPPSSPINFWSAQYQNVSGGSAVTLASGTTAPPATLATFDPTTLAAGTYAITVTATTAAGGGATAVARVIVGNGGGATTQAPPTISAPTPADGTIVTKPVPVTATISPPSGQTIASWKVTYQALDVEPIVTLASGTGTPPSPLAAFDPTLLPNDTYAIVITATASGGGIQTLTTTVAVFGNLKLGRYVTTFQDLSVPVNGFQMEVRRTYDSIDKRVGDFGIGWHVDLANFRVSANRQLGAGGWTEYPTSCIFGLCFYAFKTSTPHYVTVTFPDQHQEIFDFTPQGGAGILYWQGNAAFTARAGTGNTSKLEVAGDSSLSYDFAGNLVGGSGYFNPTQFKLTTRDGRVLILDTVLGLISVTDRNGNALNINATGIHSSNGQSITYTRDSSGRITKITGPSNQVIAYAYSANGDLTSSTDPNNNTATYTYDANHNLLSVVGPAQTRPLSTLTYDASGRLMSITDGNGNTTQISNNVPGQQQTIIDPAGLLTEVLTSDDLGDVVRQDLVFGGQTLTSTATYDAVGRLLTHTDPVGHTWSTSYDASGSPVSVSNPLGATVLATYDAFGSPTSFTDQLGNISRLQYDGNGNVGQITNALGQADQYTYDSSGHITSHTDALGSIWRFTYDAAGRELSETDPLGSATSYTYDASSRMLSMKNPLGVVTAYAYDAVGNITTVTDPLGNSTTFGYDALNRMVSVRDRLLQTTMFSYDGAGNRVGITDPLNNQRKFTYDADSRLASETDGLNRITAYTYDGDGRLTKRTLPNGGTFSYTFDGAGNQTTVIDPLGHKTSSTYDGAGRLLATTDALGNTTTTSYDAAGRQMQVVDPLNRTTAFSYDAPGRLLSVTDPTGAITRYAYDAAGRRTTATDPLGHSTIYRYDPLGRQTQSVDALGRVTTFGYDAAGRRNSVALPSGTTTSYTYDLADRNTSTVDGLGNKTSFSYDADGRLRTETDARGNATTFGFDAAGQLVLVTDALGGKATITYDAAGERTSMTNPRGDTSSFKFDSLGNLASQTDPSGHVATFGYDLAGRKTSSLDPRGISATYGYDAVDRLISVTFPGGSTAFAYDPAGQRTSMVDSTGTTTYAYDAASRPTSVIAPGGAIGYAYDAAGRRTGMTLPGPRAVAYGYDNANQLTTIVDWFSQTSQLQYNSDGHLTKVTRPGGLTTSSSYDGAGRLVAVNHDGPVGGVVQHFAYTLDANGNRTAVAGPSGTETYTLDSLNRIIQATYPNGDKISYTYDAAGNRLSQNVNGTVGSYFYNAGGQLLSAGSTTYTYDGAGNATGAGPDSFSWDWAGRLAQATLGGTNSSYQYDGDGVRIGSLVGTNSVSYLWDRQIGLPLLVDDGSRGYVQSTAGVLEQLDAGGTTTATYPLADALGSVRGLANASGAQAGATDYDVFGSTRARSGNSSVFGYTGQQTDPSGLVYLRARYLNPGLGRFLQPDTVQPNAFGTQGYNLYAYVANNPTSSIDPSGHQLASYGLQVQSTGTRIPITQATGVAAREAFRRVTYAWILANTELVAATGAGGAGAATAGAAAAGGAAAYSPFLAGAAVVGGALTGTAVCYATQCGPFSSSATKQAGATDNAPGGATATTTTTDAWPQVDTQPRPRLGMVVYRVWGGQAGEWARSWTPEDPRAYGPQQYRKDAGLPDVLNLGYCLTYGVLQNTVGVIARPSLPVAPPDSYAPYNGMKVLEFVIPGARARIYPSFRVNLNPPYGGNPNNPPSPVPICV